MASVDELRRKYGLTSSTGSTQQTSSTQTGVNTGSTQSRSPVDELRAKYGLGETTRRNQHASQRAETPAPKRASSTPVVPEAEQRRQSERQTASTNRANARTSYTDLRNTRDSIKAKADDMMAEYDQKISAGASKEELADEYAKIMKQYGLVTDYDKQVEDAYAALKQADKEYKDVYAGYNAARQEVKAAQRNLRDVESQYAGWATDDLSAQNIGQAMNNAEDVKAARTRLANAREAYIEQGGNPDANIIGSNAKSWAGQMLGTARYMQDLHTPGNEINVGPFSFGRSTIQGVPEEVQRQAVQAQARRTEETAARLQRESAEEINSMKAGRSELGQFGIDVAGQGVQMGLDAATGKILPGGSLTAMALRTFGSSAQEAKDAGATLTQQGLYGAGAAAVEVLTEKMFDGLAGIYGAGAADDIVSHAVGRFTQNRLGQAALGMVADAAGEGLEEVISDLANPVLRSVYDEHVFDNGYFGALDGEEILYDFLVGAAMGMVGGSVEGVTKATGLTAEDERSKFFMQAGQDGMKIGDAMRMWQKHLIKEGYATQTGDQSISNRATELEKSIDEKKFDPFREQKINRLNQQAATTIAREDMRNTLGAVEQRMQQLGAENGELAEAITMVALEGEAERIGARDMRKVGSVAATEAHRRMVEASPIAQRILSEMDVENLRGERMAEYNAFLQNKGQGATREDYEHAVAPYQRSNEWVKTMPRNKALASDVYGAKTSISAEEKTGHVQFTNKGGHTINGEIVGVKDGKVRIKHGKDGKTIQDVEIDQIQGISEGYRTLLQAVSTRKNGSVMLAQYKPGQNINSFLTQWDIAENGYGLTNITDEKARQAYSLRDLTDAQLKMALELGRAEAKKQGVTEEAKQQKVTGKVEFWDGKGKIDGMEYDSVTEEDAKKLLGEAEYAFTSDVLAKIVNVTLVKSKAVNGSYLGAQGIFFRDGRIYLDVNAGMDTTDVGQRTIVLTAAHELTHYIRAYNEEAYNALRDFIVTELVNQGKNLEDFIRQKQRRAGGTLTHDEALEEVIADACERMLTDGGQIMAFANEHATEARGIWKWLDKFYSKWENAFKGLKTRHAEAAAMQGRITELRQMWLDALAGANENALASQASDPTDTIIESKTDSGFTSSIQSDGTIMNSLRTFDESGRENLDAFLDQQVQNGSLTEQDAKQMRAQIEELYKVCKDYDNGEYAPFSAWSNAQVVSIDGKPVFSVVKANGEYKLNLDFSLVCKKRRTLDAVFNEMIRRGIMNDFRMGQGSIARINEIIRDHGFEVACGLCFVDSKRYRQAMIADAFCKMYNMQVFSLLKKGAGMKLDSFNYGGDATIVNTGTGIDTLPDADLNWEKIDNILKTEKKGTVKWKIANYLKENPQARKLVARGDFMSTAGFDALKIHNPELLSLYNSKKGAGGPKAAQSDVQYLNEIIQQGQFNAKAAYEVGGIRIQSFSDYVGRLVFDYAQMVADLSAKKLPAHSYTKEFMFAQQFGLTGIKINMSLVPEVVKGIDKDHAGLDADGNYTWKDGQSFGSTVYDNHGKRLTAAEGFELAKRIQNADGYSKNCGTIAVGVSQAHIEKMLDDPEIRMIIPYHKSGLNHLVAAMNQIDKYTDYTNSQNTRQYKNGTWSKISPSADFNWNDALQRVQAEGKGAREAANEYLDWCKEHGYKPKFDEFAGHPNYYKLLEDFSCYDKDGTTSTPLGAVQMNFPTENDAFGSMKDLIKAGLEEDAMLQAKQEGGVDSIVDEIEAVLPGWEMEHPEGKAKHSYGGRMAETADTSLLERAELMEQQGAKSEDIRRETGWFRGMDKIWRFEIDNKEMKITKAYSPARTEYTLEELVSHEKLFEAYPRLRNVSVNVEDLGPSTKGYYQRYRDRIAVDQRVFADKKTLKSVLAHEIQHAIQAIEGFTPGASDDYWRQNGKEYRDYLQNRVYSLEKQVQKAAEELDPILGKIGYDGYDWDLEAKEWSGEITAEEHEKMLLDYLRKNSSQGFELQQLYNQLKEELQSARRALYSDPSSFSLYERTAGEIEARDVQKRLGMNAEKRQGKRPDIDRQDVVFARYSARDFGLVDLSKDSKNNAKMRGAEIVEDDVELSFHISRAITSDEQKNLCLGAIDDATMDLLERETGRKLFTKRSKGQYTYTISYDDIRHIAKHYADNDAIRDAVHTLCGMLKNHDTVDAYLESNGELRIKLTASLPDADYLSVNVVSNSKRALDLVTVYITKKNRSQNGRPATSKAGSPQPVSTSNNNIAPAQGKSNTQNSGGTHSDRDNLGYHAGDLGKAEHLNIQGRSRDTGHFGTGTYFVGVEEKVTKDSHYGKRPQHAVDFSDYNLFKVRNDRDGYRLHDALRIIDGGIEKEWIGPAIQNQFNVVNPTGYYDLARSKYGEDWASGDNLLNSILEYARENGIDVKSLAEYKAEEGKGIDDEDLKYYYEDYVKDTIKEKISSINAEYRELMDAVFELHLLPGFTNAKIFSALQAVAEYQDVTSRNARADSYATVFMKNMGYEGVDVRGTGLDNTAYGSVIYDVKPETVRYSLRDTEAAVQQQKQIGRERLDKLRAEKNAKIEQIRKEEIARRQAAVKREKAAKWQKVAETKEHYKGVMERQRNRRSDTNVRGKIKALHKELTDMLLKPKEGRYVPKDLVKATAEILGAVDTTSGRAVKAKAALAQLKVQYDALAQDQKYALTYDETVSGMLQEITKELGEGSIYDLTGSELEGVYNTLKALKHTIQTANKLVGAQIEADAFEAANQMMRETENAKGIPTKALRKFVMAQMTPASFFRMAGGYVKNSMWEQMFGELNRGQLAQTQVLMEGGQIFRELIDDKKNLDTLHDQKNLVDIGLKDDLGNSIKITRGMMLSVYMHLQNEQNARHISYGGLTVPRLKQYYKNQMADAFNGKTGRAVAFATEIAELNQQLSEAETEQEKAEIQDKIAELQDQTDAYMSNLRAQIEKQLTEYDRKWITAAQKFFDEYSKNKLNEVTEMVYGFSKAQVDHYFPIHTDANYRAASFDTIVRDMSLENAGFMKERINGANPILLEDITDVISSQLRRTAQYVGLMPAIRNFNKAYGKARAGYSMSVQSAMSRTFENEGKKYIENLMADLNGARKTEANIFDELRGNMAGAVLTFNPRVTLAQAASFPSAAAEIGYTPLMKALTDMKNPMWDKGLQEEIAKWTPLWWYRMQGYSTAELGDIKNNEQFMAKVMDKMKWATGWIQAADGLTTGGLWQASKYYVDENFSDLKKGSDEYMMKVAEVYNRVLEKTQPDYTTMQRPDILRNPNAIVKQLTMFMTQRLQNMNILYDAAATYSHYVRDMDKGRNGVTAADVKQAKTRLIWAVSSQVAASATIVIFKALADALMHSMDAYRDDDDELTAESVSKTMLTNFAETITSNVLWGAEAFSWLKSALTGERYYGVSLNGVDTFTDMLSDGNKLIQKLVKGDLEGAGAPAWKLAKAVSQFFGASLGNVEKFVKMIANNIEDAKNGDWGTFEAGVDRTKAQNTHLLFDALQSGDTARADRLKENFKDEKDVRASLKSYIKELYTGEDQQIFKDETIKLLQQYCGMTRRDAESTAQEWTMEIRTGIKYSDLNSEFIEGNVDRAHAIKYLQDYKSMTRAEAEAKVLEWQCEKDTGIAYADIDTEVKTGRLGKTKALAMVMKYGGKSEEAADKQVEGWLIEHEYNIKPSELQEEYMDGNVSVEDAFDILVRYKYNGKEDAEEKAYNELVRWNFIEENPGTEDITVTQIQRYQNSGLEGVVDGKSYLDAYEATSIMHGVDTDGDGKANRYTRVDQQLAYIDGMDLTSEQKTSLALALGINEKSIRNRAPWNKRR